MTLDLDFKACRNYVQEIPNSIEHINNGSNLRYTDFFKSFLIQNIPCVVENVTHGWECSSNWVSQGKPDLNKLSKLFGSYEVPTTVCDFSDNSAPCKNKVIFEEFMSHWRHLKKCSQLKEPVIYLKDWHLRREHKHKFYEVPQYFASDWLNEYSIDTGKDDYMFVYMGPQGSWTPFHADVFSSFSWSANIVGKKRWLLFPPGEEKKFADSLGNYPTNVENLLKDKKYYEIIQKQGEAIFVPSGWFHQVQNLEDTISVNHNWVNGSNVHIMWKALQDNLSLVKHEINEYKGTEGWLEHCQLMLKSLFGINHNDFFEFLIHLGKKRVDGIVNNYTISFDKWCFGRNHILYDLNAIKVILEEINSVNIADNNMGKRLQELIVNISNIL